MKKCVWLGACMAVAVLGTMGSAQAQYGDGGAPVAAKPEESAGGNREDQNASPLKDGSYAAILGQYRNSEDDPILDDGIGGMVMLGYRNNGYGLEAGFGYEEESKISLAKFAVNGLLFPFESVPVYGIAGFGVIRYGKYPIERTPVPIAGGDDFVTVSLQGGLGFLIPLSWGRYEYAIRTEGLYRVGDRFLERESDFEEDIAAPDTFKDIIVNVGLQLPFRLAAPPAPPPEPVKVVEPVKICSDKADNDADGQIDFPADPGCTSADDDDETDPPQCSDGKDNDGDGQIDFPADKGCTAADDNDEVDPCKTPAPGERISLKGCGTGDVIVLRGVNFEFDKARLTPNAKTILDNVSEELKAYPEIKIELGGHTDSKGSDAYNQNLSERRAAAVKKYLSDSGIDEGRMTTAGYGEAQPVADNETDEGRELNRRVELKVTAGVAAGGTPVTQAAADAPPAEASQAPAAESSAEPAVAPAEDTSAEADPSAAAVP